MVQRRQRLRFARESRQAIRIAREEIRQDLDRDVAIELRIARAVDLAHPAGAEAPTISYEPSRAPEVSIKVLLSL